MSGERRIIIIGGCGLNSVLIRALIGSMAKMEEADCKAEEVYLGKLAARQLDLLELDRPLLAKSIIQGPPFWSADYRNRGSRKR